MREIGNQGGKSSLMIKSVANPSVYKEVVIQVTELVKSITLNTVSGSSPVNVNVGSTVQVLSTVGDQTASNKVLEWSTSDANIATVSSSGLVTGKAEGMVQITATATDGSGVSGYIYIAVSKIPVSSLDVKDVSFQADQTAKIEYTIWPKNATDKSVSFTVADPSLISVDGEGNITPLVDKDTISEPISTTVTINASDNVSKTITVFITPVKADKDYLYMLIENKTWGAYSIFDKVEDGTIRVGTGKGCIPQLVYNEFIGAWMDGNETYNKEFATQKEVDAAADRLYKAIVAMGADPDPNPNVAVEEVSISAKVYPTKVTDYVTVEADNMISVKVVSATGKVVAQEETAGDAIEINAAGFAQGVYKVIVETQNGTVVKGFVK